LFELGDGGNKGVRINGGINSRFTGAFIEAVGTFGKTVEGAVGSMDGDGSTGASVHGAATVKADVAESQDVTEGLRVEPNGERGTGDPGEGGFPVAGEITAFRVE